MEDVVEEPYVTIITSGSVTVLNKQGQITSQEKGYIFPKYQPRLKEFPEKSILVFYCTTWCVYEITLHVEYIISNI